MLDRLRRWLRRPGADASDGAAFVAPSGDNAIRTLLTEVRVPWLLPRAALAHRYGVRLHPAYRWDVSFIDETKAAVPGLLWPLWVQGLPQFSPRMPATEFFGIASIGDDAPRNLCHVAEWFGCRLGEPATTDVSNTMARVWTCGAASLKLTVWPPDLQRHPTTNRANDRDPRLKTGCHIWFKTGFRLVATAAERTRFDSFVAVAETSDRRSAADLDFNAPCGPYELEFVREPAGDLSHLAGHVGYSADREALIFCNDQLYYVPMADVLGFHAERRLPGKGGGGSSLHAECRTDFRGVATKRLTISTASGADDLNALAERLAAATGKPFQLGDYFEDG